MFYAPHNLFVHRETVKRDEYNRPSRTDSSEEFVCECRCDDADVSEIVTENGETFRPRYKVVAPRQSSVHEGDTVTVYDGDNVRGAGTVRKVTRLNYFNYSTLWI